MAPKERNPLLAYMRVQQDLDRQTLAALRATSRDIAKEIASLADSEGVGARVRTAQLNQAQLAVHARLTELYTNLGMALEASREEAASRAVATVLDTGLLRSVFPPGDVEYMLKSAQETARRGIEAVEARLGLSARPLSERVYRTSALVAEQVDRVINSALARGASARELASDVQQFVRPDTPGGVRYAAMRLGRTELNNAFHASQVMQGVKDPWVTGMKWHLSGSHPEPDECDEYARDEHVEGAGPGVFAPADVPPKPHPQCFCYTTPTTIDRAEFIRQFRSGSYDDYLTSEFPGLPSAPVASPAMKPLEGEDFVREYVNLDFPEYSDQETNAAGAYKGTGRGQFAGLSYQDINSALRGGKVEDPRIREVVSHLDSAISRTPGLEKPGLVYRGVAKDVLPDDDSIIGTVFSDDGFVSASADSLTSSEFAEGGVLLEIVLPSGSRAFPMESVSRMGGHRVSPDERFDFQAYGESEVILPRGTRFRVISRRKARSGSVVRVEAISK